MFLHSVGQHYGQRISRIIVPQSFTVACVLFTLSTAQLGFQYYWLIWWISVESNPPPNPFGGKPTWKQRNKRTRLKLLRLGQKKEAEQQNAEINAGTFKASETPVETSHFILSATYFITAIFLLHQCPPCRSLTRVLVESYRTIKESGQKFEIVFVSADRWAVRPSFSHPRHKRS